MACHSWHKRGFSSAYGFLGSVSGLPRHDVKASSLFECRVVQGVDAYVGELTQVV